MSHIRTAEVGTPIAGGSDILKINDGSDCYLLNDSILERREKENILYQRYYKTIVSLFFTHSRISDLGILVGSELNLNFFLSDPGYF